MSHTVESDAVPAVLLDQIETALAAGMPVADVYTAARLLCVTPPAQSVEYDAPCPRAILHGTGPVNCCACDWTASDTTPIPPGKGDQ